MHQSVAANCQHSCSQSHVFLEASERPARRRASPALHKFQALPKKFRAIAADRAPPSRGWPGAQKPAC
eukprot:2201779-Alexandrium_andersonii.AAC.1